MAKKLSKRIKAGMTPREKRVPPEHVGVEDPGRKQVLSFKWCVDHVQGDSGVAHMAKEAEVSVEEMETILREYQLIAPEGSGNGFWTAAEARGRAGHGLHRKF